VSSSGTGGNYPAAYNVYPNSIQLDQAALYVERVPDTVQTKHADYGFRVANFYGSNYRYTYSNKVFSQQALRDHKMYGYDPVMFYGDVYVPKVAQGMNIRVGRYISIPDIEAQLAPNNYTYSHSLLYSYDPYPSRHRQHNQA
jgi:uroporphyrinogen-III decarboxylase